MTNSKKIIKPLQQHLVSKSLFFATRKPKYGEVVWSVFNNRISCFRFNNYEGSCHPLLLKMGRIFKNKKEALCYAKNNVC